MRSSSSPSESISKVSSQWIFLTRCPHVDTLRSLLGFVADTCKQREGMIGEPCHENRKQTCTEPGGQLVQLGNKPLSRINHSLETSGWLAGTRRNAEKGERMCREVYSSMASLLFLSMTLTSICLQHLTNPGRRKGSCCVFSPLEACRKKLTYHPEIYPSIS